MLSPVLHDMYLLRLYACIASKIDEVNNDAYSAIS